MKNKKIFIILFFFLLACSQKNEISQQIDNLKKQGNEFYIEKKPVKIPNDIKIISKFSNYASFSLKEWKHTNFQASNFLPHTKFNGDLKLENKKKYFLKNKYNFFDKELIVFKDKIFYIDDYSYIYSLDLNLNLLNKFPLYKKKKFNDYSLKFSLASDGNYLFIADNLGNVSSYDPALNKLIWSSYLGVPFLSNLIFVDSNLYVINDNGKIFSINSSTGYHNWSFETSSSKIKKINTFHVSAENNKLLFSNNIGDLYCIDLKEKKLLWNINLEMVGNFNSNNSNFELSNIVLKDEDIYLSTSNDVLLNLNIKDGSTKWLAYLPVNSMLTPLVTPENIINVTKNGNLLVINKKNGSFLYKSNIELQLNNLIKNKKKSIFKTIFISSNYLYAVTKNGFFFKIDTNNLSDTSVKQITKKKNIASNILIILNSIYFFDDTGSIYKIS